MSCLFKLLSGVTVSPRSVIILSIVSVLINGFINIPIGSDISRVWSLTVSTSLILFYLPDVRLNSNSSWRWWLRGTLNLSTEGRRGVRGRRLAPRYLAPVTPGTFESTKFRESRCDRSFHDSLFVWYLERVTTLSSPWTRPG